MSSKVVMASTRCSSTLPTSTKARIGIEAAPHRTLTREHPRHGTADFEEVEFVDGSADAGQRK